MQNRFSALIRSTALTLSLGLCVEGAHAQGLAGPYLAAIQASYQNDYVAAAEYFRAAVTRDPKNAYLLQNAVMNTVVAGDFDTAVPIAALLQDLDTDRQIAGLVLVADAIATDDFDAAMELLSSPDYGFNPLLLGLLRGWVAAGQGDIDAAQDYMDSISSETNFAPLGQYHKALVLALVGNFDGAAEIFAGDESTDNEPLRVSRASIVAHAQVLVQLGQRDEAVALLDEALVTQDRELSALRTRIVDGSEVPFEQVRSPKDGAAEVFLTLATALTREEAEIFALLYTRLAQHIRPDYVEALLLSADILDLQEQYSLATIDYGRIPDSSPLYREAELGKARAMAAGDDTDGAIEALSNLTKVYPEDSFVHVSLGDMYRREEIYDKAAESYTDAIDLSAEEQPGDWRNYYVRGISYERLDRWDDAEADFRRALELAPEQPLVLNYLGYSLVEKNLKIDEARDLIERAVAGDPDNGYITDSLGWVLYRIGKYEEAVPHMERAVELLPSDPVINDHLGDVLWMVGRKTEARFQWNRALSFEPDEEANPDRIRRKLEVGLDTVLSEEAATAAN